MSEQSPTLEAQLAASRVVHERLFGLCWHEWKRDPESYEVEVYSYDPEHLEPPSYEPRYMWRCVRCGDEDDGYEWNDETGPGDGGPNYCADDKTVMPVLREMLARDTNFLGAVRREMGKDGRAVKNDRHTVQYMQPHHIIFAAADVLKGESDA